MVAELAPRQMPLEFVAQQVLDPRLKAQVERWSPESPLGLSIVKAIPYLPSDLALEVIDAVQRSVVIHSRLSIRVFRSPNSIFWVGDPIEDYGVVSRKVVTTAGVGFLVDAFQNTTELENMEFHGIGTGTTAEAAGDTALVTELTTEYNPDNTRVTGTNAEGASANIYQTVGTNELDSGTPAITEHGIFSNATVGSGVLWDRSVFAAINLDGTAGDSLQSTYEATFNSGG